MWGDLPKKNESSSDNKDLDHLAVGGAVLFVVGIACLLTVKYFPILVLGLTLGFLIYSAKFHEGLGAKVKSALFTAAFFALLYFVLFGIPLNYPGRWQGALFYSKSFCNLCVLSNQWWNNLVPDFLKKFRIFKISELMVTEYVWLSFYLGLIVSALLFGLSLFGKLGTEISEIGLKVVSVPAFLFSKLLDLLFGFWVKLGWSVTQDFGLPASALLVALSSAAAYLAQTRLAGRVPALEFQWAMSHLVYLVPVGVVVGLGLRFLPGGEALVDLFFGASRKQPPSERPGFLLGKTFKGHPFRLTEKNLHYHVEIVAPTGSGKTNLLQNLIADRITKGHGVIFLDYKAEFDGVSWMYRVAKSVNREKEIRLFSLSNPDLSVPYNPLKFGDHSDIQSALMNAMTWSESFYRNLAGMTLITLIRGLCEYRDKTGELFHLGHLYEFLDKPGKLRAFSEILVTNGCPSAASISELAARLEKPSERNNHMGLISNLNQLLFSSAGSLLSHDTIHGSFDFREAIGEGRIVYGLMNSLKLKESASVVGKILLQDLMSFVGEHYAQVEQKTHRPITLVIDEFASFATPQFIEFMDRARGAGIGIVISHQARADLKSISPEFQERVEANANTTLVSGIKNSSDAEHYSGMLGTQTTKKETVQKKQGVLWDDETGMKSVREVEEYVLHPNRLKELKLGEVFAISRTVDPKWGMIKVPRVGDFCEYEVSTEALISHFKATRAGYQNQKKERYFDLERLHTKKPGLKTELSESGADQTSETWK